MFRSAVQTALTEKIRATPTLAGLIDHCCYSTVSSSSRLMLAGKVAVITGAASGAGKATAAEFVRNGAKVILADVQDDLGRAAAAALGPRAAYVHCDVTDEAHVAGVVGLAVARHGRLDVMFNGAGTITGTGGAPRGRGGYRYLADFDRVMAAGARGALAGVRYAARVMVPRRSGSIICAATASGAGSAGAAFHPYGVRMSESAVVALVRAAAAEMERMRSGVRVNAISAETEMDDEHVANAAVYLASDEAKCVNGHNLVVHDEHGGGHANAPASLAMNHMAKYA